MSADPDISSVARPDPGALIGAAWQEFHRRDWDGARQCWAQVRAALPDIPIGYTADVTTLREAGRLDEAAALLEETLQRFPDEASAHCAAAALAVAQGNLADAALRWAAIRDRFPGEWSAWLGSARTLRSLGHGDAAEAMLGEGAARFPAEPALVSEYADAAMRRRDWEEAARRWATLRGNLADHPAGYAGGARAARERGLIDEAEALLHEAMRRFPADAATCLAFAALAHDRADWAAAVPRWEQVRAQFPAQLIGLTNGARALRELRRFDEADALLATAAERAPDDSGPCTERAWLAFIRGDHAESARRWTQVRERFPRLVSGYVDAVAPLRQAGRVEDAEQILIEAVLRFPGEFQPAIELARLSLHRRDWEQANRLFCVLRERFPDRSASYGGGIQALRELRRFAEAETVTEAALQHFPDDHGLRTDLAWLAQTARDWALAIERWADLRRIRPDFLDGWIQGARALSEAWRHDEAEALLAEAITRFPKSHEPLAQHAAMALRMNRFDDAGQRFALLRQRFADVAEGWEGGAKIHRYEFRFAEAEALLQEAMQHLPDHPQLMLDHAMLPVAPHFAEQKDWPKTLRRLERLRARHPGFEAGFVASVRALNDSGRHDQSEELASRATAMMPASYALAIQHAEAAEGQGDWQAASARYTLVRERFPALPGGEIGLARALAGEGRFAEADDMLAGTVARFASHPDPIAHYAGLATRQQNWAEALRRWTLAVERFPLEKSFVHRAYEASMRLADADPVMAAAMSQLVAAPMPDAADTDEQVRALVMQFESLGGRGLGCEFGIFQRDCGAEPLGLLRWADMPYDMLVATLRNRFEGVGTEEHTELFVSAVSGGRGEYCTRDRRGMMFMRVFVYEDETSFDKMKVSALRRLIFLTRKLIADLEDGTKIFVFRQTDRNLEADEIDALHGAMRGYGDNTLLYVRYEDAAHPNGTVELVRPGLMIGYMDRFKMSPGGQLSGAPPTGSWLKVCRNAYAIWRTQSPRL